MPKYLKNKLRNYLDRYALKEVLESRRSDVNQLLEVIRLGDSTLLNTSNTNYSFGGLHRVFQKTFNKLNILDRKIDGVLVLGFGSGSVVSILRNELKMSPSIKAVELDPVVIQLGKTYFNTDAYENLEIIEADASDHVKSDEDKYDLIVVDVYVDFEVPESCETTAFISDICTLLRPGGMIVFNKLIYNHRSRQEAASLESKFRQMNGSTEVLRIREGMTNRMIVFEKK